MKILVRLPNWLGDLVMSVGLMHQLPVLFPGSEISVIVKKGIHELLPFFPETEQQFIFSKEEYRGVRGAFSFGTMIREKEKFDLFICLPNSFSAALIGFSAGATKRVGYKNEMRQFLLTESYPKPSGLHRAEEYIKLVQLYTNGYTTVPDISLRHSFEKKDHIVVNINSEASSRRLTVPKAVEILNHLRDSVSQKILLIGAPKEKDFVASVLNLLHDQNGIENIAGSTSLTGLVEVLASAKMMLSTDSGPAHLSNALGTQTIVLFGAGNENHTAPYNKELRNIIRLGELSCEPCEKNVCVRFETPQCLEKLNTHMIIETMKLHLHN